MDELVHLINEYLRNLSEFQRIKYIHKLNSDNIDINGSSWRDDRQGLPEGRDDI